MSNPTQLTPDFTIGHLPCHDFQVSAATLGQVVAERFEQEPGLPGVIITHESQVLGMISRVKFREQMSFPDRVELYGSRPIRALLEFRLCCFRKTGKLTMPSKRLSTGTKT